VNVLPPRSRGSKATTIWDMPCRVSAPISSIDPSPVGPASLSSFRSSRLRATGGRRYRQSARGNGYAAGEATFTGPSGPNRRYASAGTRRRRLVMVTNSPGAEPSQPPAWISRIPSVARRVRRPWVRQSILTASDACPSVSWADPGRTIEWVQRRAEAPRSVACSTRELVQSTRAAPGRRAGFRRVRDTAPAPCVWVGPVARIRSPRHERYGQRSGPHERCCGVAGP